VNSSFQFGASLGVSADITLAPGVGLNVYAAPAFASNEALQDASDGTYLGADVATGVTLSLDPQLSVFVEAWANLTFVDPIQGADGSAVSPAGNAGLVYLISPDMLADVYFGVQLPGGQVTPYGGLGFTLLVR
jgi:outer membrane protein W